ncbi:hypothetical protein [Nocardioides stalactiti]|uniref:hypothetical protein n=1 Tax=Nocardioides stalactiti TaxID=2755356 RepID=UPI0015FF605A|nr:hypothetical protein [Nocardioides stalactiti]
MGRMGAIRAVGLGAVAMTVTGLGVISAPTAQAADPSFPAPNSGHWSVVFQTKEGVAGPATEDREDLNDVTAAHLNLVPVDSTLNPTTGKSTKPETAFVYADFEHVYFRFHVAALPGNAAGGYVVQFDSDGTAGWEKAVRYDDQTDTITLWSGANEKVNEDGAVVATIPATALNATTYAGAGGDGYVAWAVSRADLTTAGLPLATDLRTVMGSTSSTGAGLDAKKGGLLGSGIPTDDVLGAVPWSGGLLGGAPAWDTLATNSINLEATDDDDDGIVDGVDNCPGTANPTQVDYDDDSLGDECDQFPAGPDPDGDGVGLLDDDCPERPGLLENGCVARSITTATLRYSARKKAFTGLVRADYDQCLPRRGVAVYKIVSGPDKLQGSGKTDATGKFVLAKRGTKGKYYLRVDPRNIYDKGVACFGVKSPKMEIR